MPRIGLNISDETLVRLRTAGMVHQAPYSEIFSAVVSIMTDAELADFLARHRRLKELEKELRKEADAAMLSHIRGKTVEQLESMIAASKRVS